MSLCIICVLFEMWEIVTLIDCQSFTFIMPRAALNVRIDDGKISDQLNYCNDVSELLLVNTSLLAGLFVVKIHCLYLDTHFLIVFE
jgi:hypothetical protein